MLVVPRGLCVLCILPVLCMLSMLHGWPGADSIGRDCILGRPTEWGWGLEAGGWAYRGVTRVAPQSSASFGRGPPGCGAAAKNTTTEIGRPAIQIGFPLA